MQTPARRRQARTYRSLARNHRAAVRATTTETTTAQEGTMSDQLSDAQNSGFDPYEHARRKREQATDHEASTTAAEAEVVTLLTDEIAAVMASAAGVPIEFRDDETRQFYRQMSAAALTALAPRLVGGTAGLARLRDHLLAEADRLDPQDKPGWNLPSRNVARTLRAIVEASR